MPPPRIVSLLGLGFGDCGKGLFTDMLCRRWPVRTVVRFNGGAQAGHNVVLADGRHHTFSQFGAGSFVPGVRTLLAAPVVVHPHALLVEEEFLRAAGVPDALRRLAIDARCRVTTPYHQAAGRLRERLRGAGAHGTCGVGVGETVRHALQGPDTALRYADLGHRHRALDLLEGIRRTLLLELEAERGALAAAGVAGMDVMAGADELAALRDPGMGRVWLDKVAPLLDAVPPAGVEALRAFVRMPGGQHGCTIFEGAQGVLLDEWRGFHPHTTWSEIHPRAVAGVAGELLPGEPITHLGVIRSYTTRHGAGPLPTFDPSLDTLAEPHNAGDGWQGAFRRGHPDEVLLRYALDCVGPLDGLLVSHLDALAPGRPALRWCGAYEARPAAGDPSHCVRDAAAPRHVVRLRAGVRGDLAHQAALCGLLGRATPVYDAAPVRDAAALVRRLETAAGCPVWFGSHGPTAEHVRPMHEPP